MRILEAFGEPFSYGGQETFVMNVLEHMDRTGMEFDLLTPYYNDNSGATELVRSWGGDVYSLGCDFRPGKLRITAETSIRRFLKEHDYDVIHIHSGSNSMLAMFARLADRAGIRRIIVHSHCTGIPGWKHELSKAMTAAELCLFPTDYCACSAEAGEWRFPRSKCVSDLRILKNGINVARFRYDASVRDRVRSGLRIGEDTILIGNVGRLTYQKNQDFLINLLAKIRTDFPERDYRLLFAGGGEDRQTLEKHADELGLSDRVIFTGAIDNIQDIYQAVDVLAMPSRYEGLAIAVIEAQAAGLDIVASDAIPELAAVSENVSFIPLNEMDAWEDAITAVHERHPDAAQSVINRGFGINDAADAVRKLYHK